MLVQATPADHDLIEGLWLAPTTTHWIEPPENDEIASAIDAGLAFLWQHNGQAVGFAVLMTWVPRVMGLSAFVSALPGQGQPFLRAVLGHIFGPLNAHRVGLDCTTDNVRAIRLYDNAGFQNEGRVRECWQRSTGQWTDCDLYGLLEREWQP